GSAMCVSVDPPVSGHGGSGAAGPYFLAKNRGFAATSPHTRTPALTALSTGVDRLAAQATPDDALAAVADTARTAAAADLVVVRVPRENRLVARTLAGGSALAAEIEGSRVAAPLPEEEIDDLAALPAGLQAIAGRAGAAAALVVPVRVDGRVVGALELFRSGGAFGVGEREAARVAAAQVALILRAEANGTASGAPASALMLAAEGLSAGGDELRGPDRIVRLAVDATGASGAAIWRGAAEGLTRLAATGAAESDAVRRLGRRRHRRRPAARPAAARRPPARLPVGRRSRRCRAVRPERVRRSRGAGAPRPRARGRAPPRTRAHARLALRRRRGDLPALARAHARDRGDAAAATAGGGVGRDLPAPARPVRDGGRRRGDGAALRRRRASARA